MLTAIFQVVTRILSLAGEILGIVSSVKGAQALQSTSEQADNIFANTEEMLLKINDSVIGLAALQAQLATLQATTALDFTALTTQIAAFSPSGNTVQIEPIDTGQVTTALLDLIATYVWVYRDPVTDNAMVDNVMNVWADAQSRQGQVTAVVNRQNAPWVIIGNNDPHVDYEGDFATPALDYSTILATDASAVDWINRVSGAGTVTDGGSGVPVFSSDVGWYSWIPWLDSGHFQALRDVLLGLTSGFQAPVWPGLSNVNLGTPVPLSTGVTISEPCDGVVVHIETYPTKQGYFTFDDQISLRNIGALAFVSDDADEEFPQLLGFLNAVYCPKTMSRAAGVVLRLSADVTGTITPWTIA